MSKEKVMLQEREIYGVLKFYPYNDLAHLICKISKTKTMTKATIDVIKQMGYEVVTDRAAFSEPPSDGTK